MAGEWRLEQGIPARLRRTEARKFGLTVGPVFVALGGILLWRHREVAASVVAALGGVLTLLALVAPLALAPVERVWMALAHAMSRVTTPIFMGAVYFLVLAPVGVVMRALGKNPLRPAGTAGRGWVSRTNEAGRRGGMDRQF